MTTLKELNTTYIVSQREHECKLQEDLIINPNNLSDEYSKHSERFAWYATCYELALDRANRVETDLKRMYALIDFEKRNECNAAGVKTTERMIENAVITDDRYVLLQNELAESQKQVGLLKAARDAMIQRKDMLISLGATYRAEIKSDMSLMGKGCHEDELHCAICKLKSKFTFS